MMDVSWRRSRSRRTSGGSFFGGWIILIREERQWAGLEPIRGARANVLAADIRAGIWYQALPGVQPPPQATENVNHVVWLYSWSGLSSVEGK